MSDPVCNLARLADEHLSKAASASADRSAVTVSNQGALRQTLIALRTGASLSEHEAPPAATLQVLRGRTRLTWSDGSYDLDAGDLAVIPQVRHALHADEDAVVLLTVLAD